MKTHKVYLLLFLLFSVGPQGLSAQKTVSTAGGDASNGGASISYTVGQIDYVTNSSSAGSVAQGIQQPWEISIVTGIEQEAIALNYQVYPNPTSDRLVLEIDSPDLSFLSYQLYGVNGSLLQSGQVDSHRTVLSVENLAVGSYFLKVLRDQTPVKTFKVLKSH